MKEYRNEAGEYHRVNGPAFIWPYEDYTWWYNGKIHRYYGPARYWVGKESYSIFGKQIT